MAKKQVSEWLAEFGTHDIHDHAAVTANFKEETGEDAPWHEGWTKAEMQRAIDQRGKGGTLSGSDDMKFISTLDMAEALATKYVGSDYYHGKMGMGFAVRECTQAIREAGH